MSIVALTAVHSQRLCLPQRFQAAPSSSQLGLLLLVSGATGEASSLQHLSAGLLPCSAALGASSLQTCPPGLLQRTAVLAGKPSTRRLSCCQLPLLLMLHLDCWPPICRAATPGLLPASAAMPPAGMQGRCCKLACTRLYRPQLPAALGDEGAACQLLASCPPAALALLQLHQHRRAPPACPQLLSKVTHRSGGSRPCRASHRPPPPRSSAGRDRGRQQADRGGSAAAPPHRHCSRRCRPATLAVACYAWPLYIAPDGPWLLSPPRSSPENSPCGRRSGRTASRGRGGEASASVCERTGSINQRPAAARAACHCMARFCPGKRGAAGQPAGFLATDSSAQCAGSPGGRQGLYRCRRAWAVRRLAPPPWWLVNPQRPHNPRGRCRRGGGSWEPASPCLAPRISCLASVPLGAHSRDPSLTSASLDIGSARQRTLASTLQAAVERSLQSLPSLGRASTGVLARQAQQSSSPAA